MHGQQYIKIIPISQNLTIREPMHGPSLDAYWVVLLGSVVASQFSQTAQRKRTVEMPARLYVIKHSLQRKTFHTTAYRNRLSGKVIPVISTN